MKKINISFPKIIITTIFFVGSCSPVEIPAEITHTPIFLPEEEIIQSETPPIEKPIPIGWELELVAQGLDIPWSVVFPNDQRMFISERTGRIRTIINGQLLPEPVYEFEEVRDVGEAGLMGLALHPDYQVNPYLYACFSTRSGSGMIDRVVRLVEKEGELQFDSVILDNIPAARFHAGCRLKFGPDEKLYITTGDALSAQIAQDEQSLAGKILRVNADGSVPADNPISGSPVYSIGHRNPQGIAWDVNREIMYSSEHGPSGFDGPGGGDEINIIEAGGNYGWPLVSHDETLEGTIPPIIQFTPAEAPGSALFYDRETLPFFTGNLFFGALRGEGLMRLILSEDGRQVIQFEKIVDDVGRVREVTVGPDGLIYFTTSNRDGRADIREGDDKLFCIKPVYE